MRILVVIPTYNCENHIKNVLVKFDEELINLVDEIWVVDNQSGDRTVEEAKEAAKAVSRKIKVKVTRCNNSLGGTHKIAFNQAIKENYTHVAILHGDDQANANDLKFMIKVARSSRSFSVLGSRFSKGSTLEGYDKKRIAGNVVLNIIYSMCLGRKLSDLGSGLNLFSTESIIKIDYLKFPNDLSFNYSLILSLVRNKLPLKFVPITWRENGQISNTKNFAIFWKALNTLRLDLYKRNRIQDFTSSSEYGFVDA